MKKTEELKMSRSALCFSDVEAFAATVPKEEGKKRGLKMVAYSGKIIKDHWYWGDLAIDTSGVNLSKSNIPILADHETDRKIGFGSFIVNDKHEIVSDEMSYVETPHAAEFITLSDQGFPYEASIYTRPSKIQRLMENEEVEVNGFKMKGPGTVWRESVLRECSVVTFGADQNTKSAAMTENEDIVMEVIETEVQLTNTDKEVIMDLAKLQAEHPELFAEVVAIGKAEATTAFTAEKQTLEAKILELSTEKSQLSAENKTLDSRLLKLEKEDALRAEQGIKATADAVFASKLKDSTIPERLHSKIRKQISHEQFVENGKLDVTKFSAAIDTELADWTPKEGDEEEGAILGMSFTKSGGTDMSNVDKTVERMLKHTGQSVQ